MLGLWKTGISPNSVTLHVAIAVPLDVVLASCQALQAAGVQPLDFFGKPATEPAVIGWMPAASVFFKDPDGNLLEYLAMLPGHPEPNTGVMPYIERRVASSKSMNVTNPRAL